VDAVVLSQLTTQVAFLLILVVVVAQAIRRPYPANIHIGLFFGALCVGVGLSWMPDLLAIEFPGWLGTVSRTLIVALPYLLLRIVSDFSEVRRWLLRVAEFGMVLSVAAVIVWEDLPAPAVVLIVGYFVGFHLFAGAKFLREARQAPGVTRRRMQAAASGSAVFSLAILVAGLQAVVPGLEGWLEVPIQLLVLVAALAYVVGFAPPALLRRAWQEPELRSFLGRVAELPWLEDFAATIRGIEAGAAASFGAERASLLLWDPESGTLRLPQESPGPRVEGVRPGDFIAGQAFQEGHAIFAPHAAKADPRNAEVYAQWDARAIVAAPVRAGGEPLGVLSVYGRRAPVFAEDDLGLVQLLADQAAIVLKNRRLLEEASEVRAREEAMRIRDDFLSAAAHDLRTPLQSILGSAEVLERRASLHPDEPVHIESLHRISREAKRLGDFVSRLLDVGRAETGTLMVEERQQTALEELAHEACERHSTEKHPCVVEGDSRVVAPVDRMRISQVLDNLIDNGKKYSPRGGEITVRVWQEPGTNGEKTARIAVRDRGIGIPSSDLPHVFERFRRASNVDDRRFSGMGLGLYICRTITEQHDGRIWLESRVGEGSTFHVALPVTPASPPASHPSQET